MGRGTGGRVRRGVLLAWVAVVVALGVAGCSPEGDRTRGGGRGADVGNRSSAGVELHGDKSAEQRIYHDTPRKEP